MPTLFETLRTRFEAHQDSLRALQEEIAAAGGDATDEQDARLRDLATEVERLAPRVEQQATLERTIAATATVLARAPSAALPVLARGTQGSDPDPVLSLYRDAGSYLCDYVAARNHDQAAADRIGAFHARVPANQVIADNPGIVPEPVVGTLLQWVDSQRPMVEAFGPMPIPGYPTFYRPHVTQHTSVAKQAAEKTEIASRKMTIARLAVTAETFGGYVDLSLQNRDFTNPAIMGILVNDLAGQYAIATEVEFATSVWTVVTQQEPLEGDADPAAVAAAIYNAAGQVYAATAMLPNAVFASVDQWGRLGALFPSVNPQNAMGSGFSASSFQGAQINGLRLVISPALPPGSILVGSTQAAEVYEQRVGMLQALEVSLLGVQVGYAGYFASVVLNTEGFCKLVDVTP